MFNNISDLSEICTKIYYFIKIRITTLKVFFYEWKHIHGVYLSFKANSPVGYWDYQIQPPIIGPTELSNIGLYHYMNYNVSCNLK